MQHQRQSRPSQYHLSRLSDYTVLGLHSLQHLSFFVANSAVIPVIVGQTYGLSYPEIVQFIQRSFLVYGLASFAQAFLGHKFPIFEGPAGLWYTVILSLATSSTALHIPLRVLLTDLELGFIIVGIITMILGLTGMVGIIVPLFSPVVNGTFLVLMSVQLSNTALKGMMGISQSNSAISFEAIIVSLVTVFSVVIASTFFKGFFQTIGILFGTSIGWIVSYFMGLTYPNHLPVANIILVPEIFAWGPPTFDLGIVVLCIFTGIVVLSNLVVSIEGLAVVTNEVDRTQNPLEKSTFNKGTIINGFFTFVAGLAATVGVVPYASSIGFVAVTRVTSRLPFMLGGMLLVVMGLVPSIGIFFAGMPSVVGNSIIFIVAALCMGLGMKEFRKLPPDNDTLFAVGIPVVIGTGIMFVPQQIITQLPTAVKYLFSSGIIIGVVVSIILDNLFAIKIKMLKSNK